MPGEQNPHWLAPSAQKASDHSLTTDSSNPSSVVMRRPAIRRTIVTHATRGSPSTRTVQHPHWPLRAAPVLRSSEPQPVAQHLEQRGAVVVDLDLRAVHLEADHRTLLPCRPPLIDGETTGIGADDIVATVVSRHLPRRDFLALAASVAALSACGGEDGDSASTDGAGTEGTDGANYELIAAFPRGDPYIPAGPTQRLPFLIGVANDAPLDQIDGPVEFQIARDDGTKVGQPISVTPHGEGLPRAYLPLEASSPSRAPISRRSTTPDSSSRPRSSCRIPTR